MNELGVKGLVLPFPLNSASLEHSNGGTIEVVGGGGLIVELFFVAVLVGNSDSSLDGGWVR